MNMFKRISDALVEFFGSLFGVSKVTARPIYGRLLKERARLDSMWVQERLAASSELGPESVTPEEAAILSPPAAYPWTKVFREELDQGSKLDAEDDKQERDR